VVQVVEAILNLLTISISNKYVAGTGVLEQVCWNMLLEQVCWNMCAGTCVLEQVWNKQNEICLQQLTACMTGQGKHKSVFDTERSQGSIRGTCMTGQGKHKSVFDTERSQGSIRGNYISVGWHSLSLQQHDGSRMMHLPFRINTHAFLISSRRSFMSSMHVMQQRHTSRASRDEAHVKQY
jgi:hypothetical protein